MAAEPPVDPPLDHAILDSLAEAVTVQTPDGRLVYANEAAAAVLDAASVDELLATPIGELMERFDVFREDGSPVAVEDLPGRAVLLGEQPGPLLTRAINRRTGEERWRTTRATALHDADGNIGWAVNIVDDITDVKRAELAQRLLAQVGAALASSMDYEQTLGQVARLAVPELADWCSVSLPDERGEYMRQVAVAHVDPEKVMFAQDYTRRYPIEMSAPAGVAEVMRTGRSQLLAEISDQLLEALVPDPERLALLRTIGMRSIIIVPMTAGGRAIGTLTLVSAESGRTFTETDVDLAEELGRRSGTAVENARLYTERSRIARTLQTGLLPPALPRIPGFEAATLYRPAGEENWVGGDFYDALPVRDGWLVLVGDVAGRGADAAALTALARYTLRATARMLDDPLTAVEQLNEELAARQEMALCSMCCVHLRAEAAAEGVEATVVCAGHPLPFLVRSGEAREVGHFGPMLGAFADGEWRRGTVMLSPGDVLVLYTDGVLDTAGEDGRFGEARLQATLRSADGARDAVARIGAALESFHRGTQADDTAVLALGRVAKRTLVVPSDRSAPSAARRFVAAHLEGLLAEADLYDLRILVSELATNAFRHGGADGRQPMRLELDVSDERIRFAVWDAGPGFERPDPPAPRPEGGGNGLLMVDAIATRWDVEPGGADGTVVWFEIDRAS